MSPIQLLLKLWEYIQKGCNADCQSCVFIDLCRHHPQYIATLKLSLHWIGPQNKILLWRDFNEIWYYYSSHPKSKTSINNFLSDLKCFHFALKRRQWYNCFLTWKVYMRCLKAVCIRNTSYTINIYVQMHSQINTLLCCAWQLDPIFQQRLRLSCS